MEDLDSAYPNYILKLWKYESVNLHCPNICMLYYIFQITTVRNVMCTVKRPQGIDVTAKQAIKHAYGVNIKMNLLSRDDLYCIVLVMVILFLRINRA